MTSNISLSNVTIRLRRGSIENLPASAPAGEPLIVNNQGDYELWAGTGTGVVKISSNSGAGASFVVDQANHGFDNELVRYNSTTKLWELAYAAEVDGDSHTAIGFATSKTTDTFIVTMLGKIDLRGISYTDVDGAPLEEGEYYFLCQNSTNAGRVQKIQPASGIVQLVFECIYANHEEGEYSIVLLNYPPYNMDEQSYGGTQSFNFNSQSLKNGYITLHHVLNSKALHVQVYDNNGFEVIPDSVQIVDADTVIVGLSSLTVSGTWKAILIGGTKPGTESDYKGWYTPNIFDIKWSDHIQNDTSWLRADTFSWQNGVTYSQAYNLLLEEYNNTASTEQTESGITFKVTPRGFRIADATQEQAILNLYNTTGVAWYYIIDTTNTKFKLPRTKYDFVGLRDSVGGYVPESLPNITGTTNNFLWGNESLVPDGAFRRGENYTQAVEAGRRSSASLPKILFNASSSSSTYQDNAPVQQRATQMYLYFYVGEYTQTAVEQTAGLNAELFNGKMDRDLSNRTSNIHFVTETYKNGTSWYRVYSDGWCEQGGRYTINTNGSGTITFLKEFVDTSYTIFNSKESADASTWTVMFDPPENWTTSQITIKANLTKYTLGGSWEAKGYIK